MHTWHWHTWQGRSYLTCSLLKDWQHGFFTQQFWAQTPFELVAALSPTANVYQVKQVHGNTVLSSSEVERSLAEEPAAADPEKDRVVFPDADGLMSQQANQAVWVCTADCTPVLIADDETGQVAAVHAGWRGTALGIVQKAVDRLLAQGSQIKNLRVAMGPAIAGEVYQVSTAVAAQVGATIVQPPDISASPLATVDSLDESIATSDEILEKLRQLPNSPVFDDPQPGRVRLDVRRVNALQLEQRGIAPDQVAIAPYCTYQNPELFFSYRRERQKKVQWSGIVST
jgi:YfiH family protein